MNVLPYGIAQTEMHRILMERIAFAEESAPKVATADLCAAFQVRCPVRGGEEECPGIREYDPTVMRGGEEGHFVFCICTCHRSSEGA